MLKKILITFLILFLYVCSGFFVKLFGDITIKPIPSADPTYNKINVKDYSEPIPNRSIYLAFRPRTINLKKDIYLDRGGQFTPNSFVFGRSSAPERFGVVIKDIEKAEVICRSGETIKKYNVYSIFPFFKSKTYYYCP